tara:strand:+ start:183 stop:467 length:285 start_codon:yes stop_codon:yes gene_type:complete
MKKTESYDQLLKRFQKRVPELQERLREIREEEIPNLLDEERKVELDLSRVEGSLQCIEYLAFGKLPHDGNHGGMKDHQPDNVVKLSDHFQHQNV